MELDPAQRAAQAQFGKRSHAYGSGHILADIGDVAAAVEAIDLPHKAKILDVATGAGHTGLYFAGLGHDVTLADIAQPMLAQARAAAVERGLTVETRQHSAERLPYPDSQFDLVASRVAAHHFSDPDAFVRESSRVLKPGGWFVVIDGSVEDGHPEAEAWTHAVEKLRDPSHGRFLTPHAWRALCKAHGLDVRRVQLDPFKQPDLEWYFETAATPEPNRSEVMRLVGNAPDDARSLFRLGAEDEKIVWWWQRLTLIARKPD